MGVPNANRCTNFDVKSGLKIMEKSGNLKWLCQADLENLFILFKEGKRCTFSCLSPSPSLRATLKGKNLLPSEQFLSFNSSPQI